MNVTVELGVPLALGTYEPEIVQPRFISTVGNRSVVVRLDGGATFKLAEDAGGEALAFLLNLKRPKIRDAAQRLLSRGHYLESDDGLEIVVTAQDID